jgi:hypothetical protein
MTDLLKLQAKDAEDMQTVSAVMQDAIAPVCDMTWRAQDKNFIMVVQRLRRETSNPDGLERICCAINIRGAEAVQTHGINLNDQNRMLDLLMISAEDNAVQFLFASDARIRVQLDNWSIIVEDFGETWPAGCEPCHEAETAD